jgi:hypothetical protein
MADRAALIRAALNAKGPPPDIQLAQLRKDKKEAVRLARLKVKANARGAAPMPPKKGEAAAPVQQVVPSEPVEVKKYRAIKDFSGDISYESGATVFVLGEPDDAGMVIAVVGGASGNCPMDTLIELTDAVIQEERKIREEAARESSEEKQKKLNDQLAAIEASEKVIKASPSAEPVEDEAETEANAAAAAKAKEEIEAAKAEEEALLARAAEIEAMMAALDVSDDDDE